MKKYEYPKRDRTIFETRDLKPLLEKVAKKLSAKPYSKFSKSQFIRDAIREKCERILGDDA